MPQMHFPVVTVKQFSAYGRAAANFLQFFVTTTTAVGMHQTRQPFIGMVCRGRNGGTS